MIACQRNQVANDTIKHDRQLVEQSYGSEYVTCYCYVWYIKTKFPINTKQVYKYKNVV
jgi:hypothetical protein